MWRANGFVHSISLMKAEGMQKKPRNNRWNAISLFPYDIPQRYAMVRLERMPAFMIWDAWIEAAECDLIFRSGQYRDMWEITRRQPFPTSSQRHKFRRPNNNHPSPGIAHANCDQMNGRGNKCRLTSARARTQDYVKNENMRNMRLRHTFYK